MEEIGVIRINSKLLYLHGEGKINNVHNHTKVEAVNATHVTAADAQIIKRNSASIETKNATAAESRVT